MADVDSSVTNGHHDRRSIQTWGVPWSPLEFVEQAAKAKHPMQLDQCLPCRLGDVVNSTSKTTFARGSSIEPQDLNSGLTEQIVWQKGKQHYIPGCMQMSRRSSVGSAFFYGKK